MQFYPNGANEVDLVIRANGRKEQKKKNMKKRKKEKNVATDILHTRLSPIITN